MCVHVCADLLKATTQYLQHEQEKRQKERREREALVWPSGGK